MLLAVAHRPNKNGWSWDSSWKHDQEGEIKEIINGCEADNHEALLIKRIYYLFSIVEQINCVEADYLLWVNYKSIIEIKHLLVTVPPERRKTHIYT